MKTIYFRLVEFLMKDVFFGILPLMSALQGQESNMYYLTWDSLETITGI